MTGGTPIPPPPGQTAPNFKGAIGVTADSVEGVDITVPVYHFSETHYLDATLVTEPYKATFFALTGRVNSGAFKGLAAGECLFLGAAGTKRGGGDWEIGYRFASSPNVSGLTVGDITGINKKDSSLWVRCACGGQAPLLKPSRMATPQPTKDDVLDAIRRCATKLGRAPSKQEFKRESGITEYWWVQHFGSWREAQRAAGVQPHTANIKLTDGELLEDWGRLVQQHRQIPTREQYRRDGKFSPGVFEKHFGPWAAVPEKFREYASEKTEWAEVVALLPKAGGKWRPPASSAVSLNDSDVVGSQTGQPRHTKLTDRPTYGNPIDFRGLRHEPVNEQGVVFLFGMVAKELGYMVEAVQGAYPDCEAKRQIGPNHWQRVRIEFEFESRNFRDHGHSIDGCDVIVCWRHNWPDCPPQLQVVELSSVITTLSKSED